MSTPSHFAAAWAHLASPGATLTGAERLAVAAAARGEADGGAHPTYGGDSGGSIWLVCSTFAGAGAINADGADSSSTLAGGGGGGPPGARVSPKIPCPAPGVNG